MGCLSLLPGMCATLLVSCVQVVALHVTRLSIAAFWLHDVLQTDAMHFSFYVFV